MLAYSPIVLFVYNRPWHTKKTLDALALNAEAIESVLYIYCDGKKEGASKEQLDMIFEVRKIHNDVTFIDEFLTEDFCVENKFFVYKYNKKTANKMWKTFCSYGLCTFMCVFYVLNRVDMLYFSILLVIPT